MSWERRMLLAEQTLEDILRQLRDFVAQLNAVRQGLRQANQQLPQTPPAGGGGGAFVCMCPTAVAGAWSAGAPSSGGSFSATVYQVQGSTPTSKGTQLVYNWMTAATVVGKPCNLVPDGAGNYVVYSQSC